MDAIAAFNTALGAGFALYLVYRLLQTRTVAAATLSWCFFVLAALCLFVGNVAHTLGPVGWLAWPALQPAVTMSFTVCVVVGVRLLPGKLVPSAAASQPEESGSADTLTALRDHRPPWPARKSETTLDQRRSRNGTNAIHSNLLSTLKETDPATLGHSQRVAELAVLIAREMGLRGPALEEVSASGLLHDVGKIAVRPSVLKKPHRLTEEERHEIRSHSRLGQRLLERDEGLPPVGANVLCHHEKYDGTGYPGGLQGEEIPLIARIVAVADAFDTITYGRPYQKPRDDAEAVDDLLEHSGTQFDPAVVMAFLRALRSRRRQGLRLLEAV